MKRLVLLLWLGLAAMGAVKTGPDPGEKIPAFEASDVDGNRRDFENLKGPKGLILLFARSADW